jgi:OOP family OmpA-OmpF porin
MFTRCTGLSKSWWWLSMLLGLALLYVFMLTAKQAFIENNLQARVQQQLKAEGIKGAVVTLEQRGRDVLLSGSVATEQERKQVVKLVNRIEGVRVVNNTITVPTQAPPTLVLTTEKGTLLLVGVFPSQEQISEFVESAHAVYGENNVNNQLTVGHNIASPTWLSDSKLLFPILKTTDEVTVTLAKGVPVLSGSVYSAAEKMALHNHVQGLLSMPVTDKVLVNSPMQPADIMAHMRNGQIILKGKLASQTQINNIVNAISKPLDMKSINNQLIVSHGILPKEGRLTLSGNADGTTHKKLRLAAKDFIRTTGFSFTLKDRLMREKNGEENNTKHFITLNSSTIITKAITACQSELDGAMSGKSIHFSTNKAGIKQDSRVLLDNIVTIITSCKSALKGTEIIISGYTDSKGDERYNTSLSQRRADAVKRYLRKQGIASTLLKAKGFGEADPIASNTTRVGRAKNRRITFSVANKQLVAK